MDSSKYAINFDFKKALKSIDKMSNRDANKKEIKKLITNLR